MAAIGRRYERRAPGAGIVARAFALHLDHIGAEIGEDLARPRPRQNAGKLEDTHTAEGTRHRKLLGNRAANRRARKTPPKPPPVWRADAALSIAGNQAVNDGLKCLRRFVEFGRHYHLIFID